MPHIPQVILGAGQQAGHVLRLLEWMGLPWQDVLLFDDCYPAKNQGALGLPIHGTLDAGIALCRQDRLATMVALGSRVAAVRYATFRKAVEAGVRLCSLIHPSCVIAPSAKIGVNALLMPGCVVSSGSTVGSLCSFFSNVSVEHDCQIGDNVMMGPGVSLSGSVQVGAHCFLGAGVACTPGARIAERVLVGAGSVIVSDLPKDSVCFGVPARVRREVRAGDDAPTESQLNDLCGRLSG